MAEKKTLSSFKKVEEGENVKMLKGFFEEVINPNEDPTVQMMYKHINSGLMAFTQPGQTPSECQDKYIFMMRMAEGLMESSFNFDFKKFRDELRQEAKNNGIRISEQEIAGEELKMIGKLIQMRKRKFHVALNLSKPPNQDKLEDKEDNDDK